MNAPIDRGRLRRLEGIRLDEPREAMMDQVVLSSKDRPWKGISVWHQRGPIEDLYIAPASKHSILIRRSSPTTLLQLRGGEQRQCCWQPGQSVIVPAGVPSFWRNNSGRDNLHVDLDPLWMKQAWGDERDGDAPVLHSSFGSDDQVLFHLCQTLLTSLGSNASMHTSFADGIATALAIHLLEHYCDARQRKSAGLSHRQLALIRCHIEENLSASLRLEQLAALMELSPYHFSRCFKVATGLAPHQFVIRQRMERARHLVVATRQSLLDIALGTGFSSAAHFSHRFFSYWHVAPTALRKSI